MIVLIAAAGAGCLVMLLWALGVHISTMRTQSSPTRVKVLSRDDQARGDDLQHVREDLRHEIRALDARMELFTKMLEELSKTQSVILEKLERAPYVNVPAAADILGARIGVAAPSVANAVRNTPSIAMAIGTKMQDRVWRNQRSTV
jgi:hypothetical protein